MRVRSGISMSSLTVLLLLPVLLYGHEIRPAYLEIRQESDSKYQILWKLPTLQGLQPKITPIFPEGFALQEINRKQLANAVVQQFRGHFQGTLNGQTLRIEGLQHTLIDVLVQIHLEDEFTYTLLLQPDQPEATIPIEPNFREVFRLYLSLGIEHILLGMDHLLFVLGLLLLVRKTSTLIKTITAFTIAHSITLVMASLGLVQVPAAPVEAVIALSIIFLAKEYVSTRNGGDSITGRYPWIVAFVFGLLHGFGFAGALREIGLPQGEIPLALFTFNVGVELGQLLFIAVLLLCRWVLELLPVHWPRWSWKLVPYAIGGIASFWLIERVVLFF